MVTTLMEKTRETKVAVVVVCCSNEEKLNSTESMFSFDLAERESISTKRKTSGGPGGSTEGKSSTRGASKGGRHGGKQSPTHHSDGTDGTGESGSDKILPKFVFRFVT